VDGTKGEREGERKRESEGECRGVDGGCHNHRDASNHPQPPTPSGFGRTDEGLKGSRKRGRERERERERECVCGQSSLGFPLERHHRDAGLS